MTITIATSDFYEGYVDSEQTTYCNKLETSSIRKWLNKDFYNTAFSSVDKTHITQSAITNDGYFSWYDYADTADNIFLLSYQDAQNTDYGFDSDVWTEDEARRAQGTDYAKSQGLYVYSDGSYDGNSFWRLRTAGSRYSLTCFVNGVGYVNYYDDTRYTYLGIRPAFYFNLESEISQSCEHENTEILNAVEATCTADGYTGDTYCRDCGKLISSGVVNFALGHADDNNDGYCERCEMYLGEDTPECTCNFNKSDILKFFWNIKVFFWKIFGKTEHKYYECGEAHW